MLVLALPVFVSQANAALPLTNPPTFTFVNDENGADDQPGQKDLSSQAVAVPAPGDLWVSWKWDVTSLSGGNTGDGCALFDTDGDSKVNFAICVTIQGNPAVQAATSPRVYTCGDGKVDRCTSTYTQITPINSACATNTNATDPFHSGQKDTQAICHIDLADVGGAGTANLVNTCSYPSQQPTSDPSDCVLIPRDAFLRIAKVASPDSGSFPFRLGLTTDAAPPVVFTAAGTQTSSFIAIRSDAPYKVKEDIPTNWSLSSASCTGASGSGSSNGTRSGDTISGIDASPDNQITCTFNDVQQTGAIEITKLRSGTTTGLAGAHFTIDGAGDYVTGANGKVCVADLSIGSHTVVETQAPNGHDLPATTSQNVSVTGAGTCAAGGGAATVSFSDPLHPGRINITKTKSTGGPLAGAVFALYKDNAPVGGTAPGAEDTAVAGKTCTTDAQGKCSITDVVPGDYWVVETSAPAGYIKADPQTVNVGIGTSPGTGDTDELSFVNAPAAGRINIHKTGLGGAALAGAEFTLYIDADPLTTAFDPVADTPVTGKKCTTDASGDCSITDVAPGDYWLKETVTPPGYSTVDPEPVTVPIGSGEGTGATVPVNIADPVVNGTINIHKKGINGSDLEGATFTLYVNNAPLALPRGAEDTATAKTCTTDALGDCSITNVVPGNYIVVETTTPAGYDTAPDQAVVVGIGPSAGVGDTDNLEFTDPVVNGKVSITKTDDADNALAGAEFTLYADNAPTGGSRGGEDTITTKTCTTAANGKCDITDVPPGDYWVVETKTPDHYDTAADKLVHVGLGSAAHEGDTVPVSFVDNRKHRVIVLVCHEGTNTLHSSDVTIDNVTKQSLSGAGLTGAEQAALCNTGGASFGDISGHGDVNALIEPGAH
jgi:hypothetical protein